MAGNDCCHSGTRNEIYVCIRRTVPFATHFAFTVAIASPDNQAPLYAHERILEVYETSEEEDFEPHGCYSDDEMHIAALFDAMENPELAPILAGIDWAGPVMDHLLLKCVPTRI